MNWKFWETPAAPKKKLVGMSNGKTTAPQQKQKEPAKVVNKGRGLLAPMQPYIAIVKDDIKRLLRIDSKARMDRETYRDFMEEHFKK